MIKIPIAEPVLGEEELTNVMEAVKSGWISSKGKFTLEFEKRFADYHGIAFGIVTSNGTTALHLALAALGIGPGDEVIVPTLTFIATANVVRYTGAKPVFVDSHPDYWCIDPEKVERAITPRTKVIIPVHLYGHPCDMDALMDIARRRDLRVIEDAAEAHGATYKGKVVGSFGDISCFSFYANKVITTGEGGICITNQKHLAERMRILRDHGMNPAKRYWHEDIGFNYRMTNLQAAIGVAQVKKLDQNLEKKRQIALCYSNALKALANRGLIKLHPEMPWAKCIYWMYSILLEDSASRNELADLLEKRGIETRPLFYPVHIMPPYDNKEVFPVAEKLSKAGISLPSGLNLRGEQLAEISGIITQFFK